MNRFNDECHGYKVDRHGPCYGCKEPKRHEGCHSTCDEYIDWNAERLAEKEYVAQLKKKEGEKRSYIKSTFDKQWRRNGWKTKK